MLFPGNPVSITIDLGDYLALTGTISADPHGPTTVRLSLTLANPRLRLNYYM